MPSDFRFSGYLETEEVRAIINNISAVSLHPERDALLLELLWQSGARVSEAITLKPERVGLTSVVLRNLKQMKRIKVEGGPTDLTHYTKVHDDSATKEVEVSKELCQQIKDFCQKNDIEESQWIFKGNMHPERHLSSWYVWWIVTRASAKAGVFRFGKKHPRTGGKFKGAYPHLFRHSSAMHLLEETNNIMLVKQQLGYSTVSTTQQYAYVKSQNIKKEVSKIKW